MSTIEAASPSPSERLADMRKRRSEESFGMVWAIGGRCLWRLWAPLTIYAATGALCWIWLWVSGAPIGTSTQFHTAALVLTTPLWVALLWLWDARFALPMAYSRGPISPLTWTLSVLGPPVLVVVSQALHMVELPAGPLRGWSVLAISDLDPTVGLSASDLVNNASLIYFAILASPLLVAVSFGALVWLPKGAAKEFGSFVMGLIVAFVPFVFRGSVEPPEGADTHEVVLFAPIALSGTFGAIAGWRIFRQIPAKPTGP